MEQLTPEQQIATAQGMGAGLMIFVLALMLLIIIIQWRINVKANQPGWGCIIPIYNIIIYLRIIGRPASWFFVYLGCFALYGTGLGMIMSGSGAMGGMLTSLGLLAILIISIIDTHRLSKSFGKGTGFTVGLILLSPIFLGILAFDSSVYIGPNGVGEASNDNPDILHS